jgi:pimeloyl-ACP methyl ester carboxylesterase
LVGHGLGGVIAARFASADPTRLSALVLVDTLGLRPFEPAPEFGHALEEYFAQPDAGTHDQLWRYCAFDIDALRRQMGDEWALFAAYDVDRARNPSVKSALHDMMGSLGFPAIDADVLARIAVPTSLVWGRHDIATPLSVAKDASARHGWPLHVIDGAADDPIIEQPVAFVRTLRKVLAAASVGIVSS